VPLFAGAKDALLRTLAVELRFECFPAGARVFRLGRVGEKVYFVIGGRVELRSRQQTQVDGNDDDGDDSDDEDEFHLAERLERSASRYSESVTLRADSLATIDTPATPTNTSAATTATSATTTATSATTNSKTTTTIVGSGAMFGECELLRAARRSCTALALDSLQLLSLSGAACRRVLARFPDFEQRVVRAATAGVR
jgi:CRP-like cAMP-binding protein